MSQVTTKTQAILDEFEKLSPKVRIDRPQTTHAIGLNAASLDADSKQQLQQLRQKIKRIRFTGETTMQWGGVIAVLATVMLVLTIGFWGMGALANGYVSHNIRELHVPENIKRSDELEVTIGAKASLARAYAERAEQAGGESCTAKASVCAGYRNAAIYLRVQGQMIPGIDLRERGSPVQLEGDVRYLAKHEATLGFEPKPQVMWALETRAFGAPISKSALSAAEKKPRAPYPWGLIGVGWVTAVGLGLAFVLYGRWLLRRGDAALRMIGEAPRIVTKAEERAYNGSIHDSIELF